LPPAANYDRITHERPQLVGYYTPALVHLLRHTSPIPEGAGLVKGVLTVVLVFFGGVWARRIEASGSRLGRSPTAERPEGLDAGAAGRTMSVAEKVGG
jgi:hypothetical protein